MPKHRVSDWTARKDRGSWYLAEGVFDRTMNRITRGQWPEHLRGRMPLKPEPVSHVRTAATRMDHTVGSIARRIEREEFAKLRAMTAFPNPLLPVEVKRSPYELRVQTPTGDVRTLGFLNPDTVKIAPADTEDVLNGVGDVIRTDKRHEQTITFEIDGFATDAYRTLAGLNFRKGMALA